VKNALIAAATVYLVVVTPAWAESVDPETILSDLHADSKARVGWKESRSMWDGHVGRPKARWRWQMKVTYSITPKGRMMNCNVIAPSGSASFDNAACTKLTRESRFEPKRDATGKAVRSRGEITYQLFSRSPWICGTGLDEEEAEAE
jgi:TonB family protein